MLSSSLLSLSPLLFPLLLLLFSFFLERQSDWNYTYYDLFVVVVLVVDRFKPNRITIVRFIR
ncbi:uncharacterized protein Smp_204280 [Schistosoma mansoni]|uniref:Uncharacterized protein n=1 Tax=Schistosoma mansoni TaxID=6183 RepID=G4VT75_SCHMA|nr:uncharacterized protein Smp_204280 [Schistosoma mansoni]|eukprot:XP_018655588.1 uncharacterized protein Smp_204280 [Schistosoma mansoni]